MSRFRYSCEGFLLNGLDFVVEVGDTPFDLDELLENLLFGGQFLSEIYLIA